MYCQPNTKDDIGQGFINYTIRANKNIPNGATIDAKAQIFFDDNEPIDTPEYINTIDIGKPTSTINPPASTTVENAETINLSLTNITGGGKIGDRSTATLTILDNIAPTITNIIPPDKIKASQMAEFITTATDLDRNDTLTYSWNFGDNTQPVVSRDATHTFTDNGNYDVVLTVNDLHGGITTQTTTVKVDNIAPTIVSIVKPPKIDEGESAHILHQTQNP